MAYPILRNVVYLPRNYGLPILQHALQCTIASPRSYANVPYIAKFCSVVGNLPTSQKQSLASAGDNSLKEPEDEEVLLEFEKEFTRDQKEYMLPSTRRKEHSKILLMKIRESRSSDEIFSLYRQYSSVMDVQHLLNVMEVFDNLVVEGSVSCLELQQNEDFQDICQILLKSSRRMETSELISLLHYSCQMNIDVNSKLVGTILQLLKHNLNDLNLRELLHLEFLLRKFSVTPLSQAILSAIPLLVENALIEEPLGHVRSGQLSQILALGVQARIKHLGRVLNEIYKRRPIKCHLFAKFLLRTLLEMFAVEGKPVPLKRRDQIISEVLVKDCMESFVQNLHRYTLSEVESVLTKVCAAYSNLGRLCCNEHFLNAIAFCIIRENADISRASRIVNKFLKLDFISEELTDYVISSILQSKTAIDEKTIIWSLITVASSYSTSPDVRQKVIDIILMQSFKVIDFESCLKFPSLNMALDLLSIGYYNVPLLEIVTSSKFLDEYTSKYSNRFVISKQLLLLNQVLSTFNKVSLRVPEDYVENSRDFQENQIFLKSDLLSRLFEIYDDTDGSYVVPSVLTASDLYIDYFIVLNESNIPVKVLEGRNTDKSIRISDLNISHNHKRIAVLDVKPFETYLPNNMLKRHVRIHQQLLEASNFIVVPVLQRKLNQLKIYERNLYIKELISDAVNAHER